MSENTIPMMVTIKKAEEMKKKGLLVEKPASNLPPHLQAIFDEKAKIACEVFGKVEVLINRDKYDDFHPIHAIA